MAKVSETPDDRLESQLQRLFVSLQAASPLVISDTQDELLRSIVETAARIFGAAAASIALVNENENMLVFKVAYGEGNATLEGLSIPIDSGIAGYVAMTGQPIAISDVSHDPRFHKSFAESTGYVPRSILASPLLSEDRVIGVMEVLDKIKAPYFNLQDMELLGLFAQQAAIAIHQSLQVEQFGQLFLYELKRIISESTGDTAELLGIVEKSQRVSKDNQHLAQLISLLAQIQAFGDAEFRASLQVLNAMLEYWQSQKRRLR
jgi:GAF domain-containing protein